MCGICGIINRDKSNGVSGDLIVRMRDVMTHRGPDEDGVRIDGHVGLGFRRLSIVDLSSGHQPMSNEDGTVWIVFNGEIYNHAEIKKDLVVKGHVYKTRCDTETIVHLYEEEGLDGFSRMNGMFGIAIWDSRKDRLVLVRDRLGIKPLYYAVDDSGLIFASEIKSILESGRVTPELDPRGLEEYLVFRFVAGEKTLFKNIFHLLPGHILVYERGQARTQKFWDIPSRRDICPIDIGTAVGRLEELLGSSVDYRLMSDVPLGTFCSGGVDSSLVTAIASGLKGTGLNTFSVGFTEADYDESHYAQMVASRFGTTHHTITIENAEFSDSLPRLVWHNDEPLNHANSVQIYHVSKLAKEFVTVVLTGEGSDELFGGYPRYFVGKARGRLDMAPGFARRLIGFAAERGPSRRLKKIGGFLPRSLAETAVYVSSFVDEGLARAMLRSAAPDDYLAARLALVPDLQLRPDNLAESMMLVDLKNYLVSILLRQDKMSMAASIEARVPFLDYRIVEWAVTVPLALKLDGVRTKRVVKELAERMLPREVVHRRKYGFGVPLGAWFKDERGLGRYLELFREKKYAERGYIDSVRVGKLVEEHLAGRCDHGDLLWALVNLELWHRTFLGQ